MKRLKRLSTVVLFLLSQVSGGAMAGTGSHKRKTSPTCVPGEQGWADLSLLSEKLQAPVQDSPFLMACQSPLSVAAEPKTGFFVWSTPPEDARGVSSKEFFVKLVDRLLQIAHENENLAANIQHCTKTWPKPAVCIRMLDYLQNDFTEVVKEARFEMALAQGPWDVSTGLGRPAVSPNAKLWTTNLYKSVPWDPLEEDELKTAKGILKDYRSEIATEVKKRGQRLPDSYAKTQFSRKAEMEARLEHHHNYRSLMGQYPFLQFIHSRNPSLQEFGEAGDLMAEKIKSEIAMLTRWKESLQRTPDRGTPPNDVMGALNYTSVVEGLLLQEPRYCGVASAAKKTVGNRELATAVIVGLPVMAACILAPPLIAVPLGVGVSGWAALSSEQQWQEMKNQSLSQFESQKGGEDPQDLATQRNRVQTDAGFGVPMSVVMPLAIVKLRQLRPTLAFSSTKPGAGASKTISGIPPEYRSQRLAP